MGGPIDPAQFCIVWLVGYNTAEHEDDYTQQANAKSMTPTHLVIEGRVNSDGGLDLDSKLALPPGRVQLIVQPLPELPKDDPFWQRMQNIWAGQRSRGQMPRGKDEIDAEIQALRDEAEEELQAIERIQEQSSATREGIRQQGNKPA